MSTDFEPLRFLEASLKSVVRIGQTAAVLSESSLRFLLTRELPAPRLLRQTFEKLGATYVKLGQFIASAPSLFPGEYVLEFQNCLDRTEGLPWRTMENILKAEYKQPLDQIFQKIDPRPLASASIAQVHAATLHSGEDIVLKIQKPGVADVLLTDLNFLYLSARLLELLAPDLSRTSLSAIVSDIQTTMLAECDFLKEARHMDQFREFLVEEGLNQAYAPRVYHRYTTEKVIAMERLYGVPLTDLESIKKVSSNPEKTLITALNTWFASLLGCEFFHADLHAGNLLVLEDGRIGFIDFGIVGRIQKGTWEGLFALMESMNAGHFETMARSLIKIGATADNVDERALTRDLEILFRGFDRLARGVQTDSLLDQDINRLLIDLVEVGEKHGIRFPREFALLVKQFLYFDRFAKLLAPDLDMWLDNRIKRLQ